MERVADSERISFGRYEAKYLIEEPLAGAMARAVRAFCSPDRSAGPDGRYRVNTLYFDTADLRFYFDTRFKSPRRFKPRVRFYGPEPSGHLWVELKHRVENVTWKTRRRIPIGEWPGLLYGPTGGGPAAGSLGESFEDVVLRFHALPVLRVRYVREAYVSDLDDYARVTFDRSLTCRAMDGSCDLSAADGLIGYDDAVTSRYRLEESPVILELKSLTRVPLWLQGLIRQFGLTQTGFSKYCCGIECQRGITEASLRASRWFDGQGA